MDHLLALQLAQPQFLALQQRQPPSHPYLLALLFQALIQRAPAQPPPPSRYVSFVFVRENQRLNSFLGFQCQYKLYVVDEPIHFFFDDLLNIHHRLDDVTGS